MKTDDIKLDEMRKWSWATTYEKECCKLDGVTTATANLENKVLRVEYDENMIDKTAIEKKLLEVQARFINKGFVKKPIEAK